MNNVKCPKSCDIGYDKTSQFCLHETEYKTASSWRTKNRVSIKPKTKCQPQVFNPPPVPCHDSESRATIDERKPQYAPNAHDLSRITLDSIS